MAEAYHPHQGPQATTPFLYGLWKDNPILVQQLGMCPTLAVTNSVINAVAMGLATAFVLICSSALVSLMRKLIPKEVRIASYIIIIATFVTVAEYIIQAISVEVHKSLGAFIALIVVNCIILGRAEAYASKNPVLSSAMDALGQGLGFTGSLLAMGSIREVLGAGTFAGIPLFGPDYEPWVMMILPSGGFFVLGGLILLSNILSKKFAFLKR